MSYSQGPLVVFDQAINTRKFDDDDDNNDTADDDCTLRPIFSQAFGPVLLGVLWIGPPCRMSPLSE